MSESLIEADVLVVGGGAAGVAAAVSASRTGAHVVLLERHGFLGGLATTALVGTVCGLYLRSESALRWANEGLAREFGERLASTSGTEPVQWKHGLRFLPYDPLAFRVLCDDLLAERGVELLLHTSVTRVHVRDGAIEAVTAFAWDREITVVAREVIDATGHAVVTSLAGGELTEDSVHQAPAFVFSLHDLEPMPAFNRRLVLLKELRRAVTAGELPAEAEALSIVPGTQAGSSARFKLGLRRRVSSDLAEATRLEQQARRLVVRLTRHLRQHVASFRHARVVDLASQLGIRTGRRAVGLDVLTGEHVLAARTSPTGIATGAWPIEDWGEALRPRMAYLPLDTVYEVPADCLRASSPDNLWLVGRHLSATDEAIASARVIGTCLATGAAAGTLAACRVSGRGIHAAVALVRSQQVPGNAT